MPIPREDAPIEIAQELNKNVSEFQRFFGLRQAIEEEKILVDRDLERRANYTGYVYSVLVAMSTPLSVKHRSWWRTAGHVSGS